MAAAAQAKSNSRETLRPWERWLILPFLFILDWTLGYGNPRVQRLWARLFHILSYPFLGAKRRITRANLAVAFPELTDREISRLTRRNQRYLIEMGLDWLHFFIHPGDAEKRLDVAGNPVVQALRQRPPESQGVIFCTPHLGNWELEAHISFLTGRPGAVIAATFDSPLLNRLVRHFRQACPETEFIPVRGAARGLLKAWKAKRDLGLLIDQNLSPRHGGVFVPFFGLAAATSNLPATMAMHLNAEIYVTACIKRQDGSFVLEAERLPASERFSSPEELTAAVMLGYEAIIRRHPEQYLWLYPRWRYIPENAPEEYRRRFPFYARLRPYRTDTKLFEQDTHHDLG